jgi:site-specific DNA-methyltransferase (adenine-specific)
MAVRIEDAGFEIRDMIAWVYGSGFPKSLDVSKAIDKAAGAEREVVGTRKKNTAVGSNDVMRENGKVTGVANFASVGGDARIKYETIDLDITAPATEAARKSEGWGTALKPALEPITVARKPLIGTVADNVLEHGTGGLNIDGCRVGASAEVIQRGDLDSTFTNSAEGYTRANRSMMTHKPKERSGPANEQGRWPANLIHDGSDEVVGLFPQSSVTGSRTDASKAATVSGTTWGTDNHKSTEYTDTGSAARFFYCAKASKKDRDEGCEGLEAQNNMRVNGPRESEEAKHSTKRSNHHPTVKPTDLMRYLCRLVTPPGGVVLDPFMGSGSTGKAAMLEGFQFIGCELSEEYAAIATARIEAALNSKNEKPLDDRQGSLL